MNLLSEISDVSEITIGIPEHVLFQQVEQEAVLLDVKNGGYFGLNPVGTFIWQLLVDGQPVSSVLSALCEHYEISKRQATADLQAFLTALEAQGLIKPHETHR